MGNPLSKEEREYLKNKYTKYFLLVREIINQLDPVGLIEMGAPEDEHDTLTGQVLRLIVNNQIKDVRQTLIDSYDRYGFGADKIEEEFKGIFYKHIEETTDKINNLFKKYRIETYVDP
ncbi:MAG: hypothetical protein K0R57_573 [Paenibacillaceae bacterium]|nr:hypothetical protein [Paenibacillaceae bacterium]